MILRYVSGWRLVHNASCTHGRASRQKASAGYGFCAFLCALSLSAATVAPPGLAQTANKTIETDQRPYAIAPGKLSDTLAQFAALSGIQLVFDAAQLAERQSPGLNGRYTTAQGFSTLLQDSGYVVQRYKNGGYRLVAEDEATTALLPVRISAQGLPGTADSAYRIESATINILGEKAIKDTPYSIESYSRELIDNKQARSLAGLAKGDASISLMMDNIAHENYSFAIRGIQPDSFTGQKIDGLNARVSSSDLPLEHLAQVQILKGASGFLYGFGAPGGIINYLLKRPTDKPYRSLSAQVMDSGLTLAHGDVGGRLGAEDRFGYRVNLLYESGDTYIDNGESRRNSGSIALDWRITPDLVWRVDALAGEHTRKGGYYLLIPNSNGAINFSINKPPAPIDGSRRLAPSYTSFRSVNQSFGTDLSWDIAAGWALNLAYRYSDNGREPRTAFIFADSSGDYSLALFDFAQRFKSDQSQALISGVFRTGPITHTLTVGASYNKISDARGRFNFFRTPNVGNLSNPVEVNNPFGDFISYKDTDIKSNTSHRREVFISDTLQIGKAWDIILGLRHSSWDDKFTKFDKSATTPAIAMTFRPMDGLSLYGNYIEALEQGTIAPGTAANAGQVFSPLVSKQYEFGAKAEVSDWSVSAALFRIQRGLTYTTPANILTQDGEARYQGLELNGKFRFSRHWLLTASAMWLDAVNQKTTGGQFDGKRVIGTAREQFSLYSEYRLGFMPLTLTAGARYVGKRAIDPNNRFYVGDVALLDIGARYETEVAGQRLTLRLNVDNLANQAYWGTVTLEDGRLQQGAPRTIKLGAQLEF